MVALSYLCLVTQFCFGVSVPVFVWSNDKSIDFPRVIVGHHTSRIEFSEKYLRKFNDHVVVFVQDELSVTDILVHGGVYGSSGKKTDYEQLKSAMREFTATYLPNVENPLDSLLKLASGDKALKMVSVNPNDIISSLHQADFSKKSLFFVDLSLSKRSKAEYDAMIGKVVSYLNGKCLFSAVFAGRHHETIVRRVSKTMRHLDSTYVGKVGATINGSFMFKFNEINLISTGQSLMDYVAPVSKNECDDYDISSHTNCTVEIIVDFIEYGNVTLAFTISTFEKNSVIYWYGPEVRMQFQLHAMDFNVKLSEGLAPPTPLGFSYSCGTTGAIQVHKSDIRFAEYTPQFEVAQYQVQFFRNVSLKGFGRNVDCVKMITTPICMALICIGLCLSILGFGIYFLLGINPPDKFDNPKRKFFINELEN